MFTVVDRNEALVFRRELHVIFFTNHNAVSLMTARRLES